MEDEKNDGVDEGIISDGESPGEMRLGIGVEAVTGMGGEEGPREGTNNSFVSIARW